MSAPADRPAALRPSKRWSWPAVTVTVDAFISFNAATFAALGSPARVALYWDDETGTIGIRAASGEDASLTYAVSHSGPRRHRFGAIAFCKALGIYGTARPLPATVVDGVLIAETREP